MHNLEISPYLEFGDQVLVDSEGVRQVPVYVTNIPALRLLPFKVAQHLAAHDLTALTDDETLALLRAQVLTRDLEGTKQLVRSSMAWSEQDTRARNFVLLPTSYCNMGCTYCGQEHTKGGLDDSHRDLITRRVLAAFEEPSTNEVDVAWFGGEPLMAFRTVMSMAAQFVEASRATGKKYESMMTTNGALLTPGKLVELVESARVTRFDITLDGPEAIHNEHRPLKSGNGSFRDIIDTLRFAAGDERLSHVQFVLRTNVDRHNVDYVPAYLEQMAGYGLSDPRFIYQLSPIHSWGNDVSGMSVESSEVTNAELTWFAAMARLGLRHSLLPAQTAGATCVATHRGSEVIDKIGRQYSCTEEPLVPRDMTRRMIASVASLKASMIRPKDRFDDWSSQIDVKQKASCSQCSLLPVCGGGCPKRWDEGERACPTLRSNVRGRITLLAMRAGYLSDGMFRA